MNNRFAANKAMMTLTMLIAAVFLSGALASEARAATYTVDTTADDAALTACAAEAAADCSLRGAINNANATTDDDTIDFLIPMRDAGCTADGVCTITLMSGQLTVNSTTTAGTLTITNSTVADELLISGNNQSRVFAVNAGGNLTLNGITVMNGTAVEGGGILNRGTLTLVNSIVSGNTSGGTSGTTAKGGGILNSGTLTLTNSIVTGNTANDLPGIGGGGGGIYISNGTVTLTNSTVSNNTSQGGGGIYNSSGGGGSTAILTLTNSTVSNNTAQNIGGGIFNGSGTGGSTAILTLTNSTINNNMAQGNGGGIYNSSNVGGTAILTLTNSTVNNNTAQGIGRGGGIYSTVIGPVSTSARLTLTNSTVSGNTGRFSGGINNIGTLNLISVTVTNNHSTDPNCTFCVGGITGTANLQNTIVAGNTAAAFSPPDFLGTISPTSSFNLIGDGTGMTGIIDGTNGNQVGSPTMPIDPKLGPLSDNGGPTQTHALMADSLAIDRGNSFGLTTDQRGLPRPRDGNGDGVALADIGAFELQTAPSLANGQYIVIARHSNKFLDVIESSLETDAAVIQYEYNGGYENQQWIVELQPDGFYKITAAHSGKVLTVRNNSEENGDPVVQRDDAGGDNQRWSIVPIGDGFYNIIAKQSGKLLDVTSVSLENGTPIIQYEANGGFNQQWRFEVVGGPTPTPTPTPTIQNGRIAFSSYRDGGNLEIYVMNADGSNQTRLTTNSASDSQLSWGGALASPTSALTQTSEPIPTQTLTSTLLPQPDLTGRQTAMPNFIRYGFAFDVYFFQMFQN